MVQRRKKIHQPTLLKLFAFTVKPQVYSGMVMISYIPQMINRNLPNVLKLSLGKLHYILAIRPIDSKYPPESVDWRTSWTVFDVRLKSCPVCSSVMEIQRQSVERFIFCWGWVNCSLSFGTGGDIYLRILVFHRKNPLSYILGLHSH